MNTSTSTTSLNTITLYQSFVSQFSSKEEYELFLSTQQPSFSSQQPLIKKTKRSQKQDHLYQSLRIKKIKLDDEHQCNWNNCKTLTKSPYFFDNKSFCSVHIRTQVAEHIKSLKQQTPKCRHIFTEKSKDTGTQCSLPCQPNSFYCSRHGSSKKSKKNK